MKTKFIYIIGAIVVGLASTLAIIFGLVGGDVIEVEKTAIVFESASNSAIYDGTEHTCDEYKIVDGELKSGHKANVVIYGTQINVGSSPNYMSVTIVDQNGTDVSDYYTIETKFGTISVEKAPLFISSKSKEKKFDGTPLENKNYELGKQSLLASGHTIEAEYSQSITNVGSIQNEFSAIVLDENGNDVSSNYNIYKEYGSLVVNKKNITIKSDSANKIYDGTLLEAPVYFMADNSLIDGHFLKYDNKTSITDVAIVDNVFTYEIVDKDNNDVSSNYEVTEIFGTLQVGIREITILSGSTNEEYNGSPITKESYEILEGELAEGDTFNITYTKSRTDVGSTENQFIWTFTNSDGKDVTADYIVTPQYGDIEVYQREITLTSATKDKVYDGTALTNTEEDLNVTNGSLVESHTIDYRATTSIIDVTDKPIQNAMNAVIFDNKGAIVTQNYKITYKEGTLAVTKRPITLKSATISRPYNGLAIDKGTVEETGDGAVENLHTFTYNLKALDPIIKVTDAPIKNEIEYSIVDKNDSTIDVSKNYEITIDEGTLEITKRDLYIESLGATKAYDGTPLSKHEFKYLNDTSIADGDVITPSYLYTLTKVNITGIDADTKKDIITGIDNEFTVSIENSLIGDATSNYNIHYSYGKLTVTKRQLTIHTDGDKQEYDGKELKIPSYTKSSTDDLTKTEANALASGDTLLEPIYKSITNVGKVTNDFDIVIKNGNLEDVTRYYVITTEFGTLEITPIVLKIKLINKSKMYDSTPLTINSTPIQSVDYNFTQGSLLTGHSLTFSTTSDSTITGVGTIANEVDLSSIDITDTYGNDYTSNYDITFTSGTLEITKKDISVRSDDKTDEYSGSPLTHREFAITYGTVAENDYIVVSIDGKCDYIGTSSNSISNVSIFRKSNSAKKSLIVKEGVSFSLIDTRPTTPTSHTIDNGYTVTLLGFNGDLSKCYIVATDNYNLYYGMADTSNFETITGFNPLSDGTGDKIVTSSYNLTSSAGTLQLVYSKETTGLSKAEEYAKEYNVLQINADTTGPVYLRSYSYTKYNGNSWEKGTAYSNLLDDKYSYNYLTSSYLNENGKTPTSATIKLETSAKTPYVVPYYQIIDDDEDKMQTSDVLYSGTSTQYKVNYYQATYSDIISLTKPRTKYTTEEAAYYTYCLSQYTQIPENTKTALLAIMGSTIDTIDKVVSYVSSEAKYNMSYDRTLDAEADKVVAFLTKYKQGVCSHFAEAATMMLRALGIPARYVSGYYAYAQAGEWVTITNMKRHAWTEVYLQGIGWVQIDATGGNVVSSSTPIDYSTTYTVRPNNIEYKATSVEDGKKTTIYAPTTLNGFDELIKKGYTYKKVEFVVGQKTGFGKDYSIIDSFAILDPNGFPLEINTYETSKAPTGVIVFNDGSDLLKVRTSSGKMQIYLKDFNLTSNDITSDYDGNVHSDSTITINTIDIDLTDADALTAAKTAAGLDSTHEFSKLQITGSLKDYGTCDTTISYAIKDDSGNDVTDYYKVTLTYGTITINQREITIQAQGNEQTYSGDPIFEKDATLNSGNYVVTTPNPLTYLTSGSLATGDYIYSITFNGSQTMPGSCNSTIKEVVIKNASNEDVTSNYYIKTIAGTIIVNEPTD